MQAMLHDLQGDLIRERVLVDAGVTNLGDRCSILIYLAKAQ